MASTETLTSLAMLKVQVDIGSDYLEYLRPFVLQVLVEDKPAPVTDRVVGDSVRKHFGLELPNRVVQLVLQRVARAGLLKRDRGVFYLTGEVPNPGLMTKKAEAERHITAIVNGLLEFAKTYESLKTREQAITALTAFLGEFNIPYLRAYLRGTAIPEVQGRHGPTNVLISQYVLDLHQRDPARFDSFMVLLQGHMLANALLCPDLDQVPQTYRNTVFYLDTPILVRCLGLEGEERKAAVVELIALLVKLGARVAAFSHSVEELERVIKGAADNLEARDARAELIAYARRASLTRSDLLLLAGKLEDLLSTSKIKIVATPRYTAKFQIDESAFGDALDDEISYFNPRARDFDVNSVRSIYVLRADSAPRTLERANSALVTTNRPFAKAAFLFGQGHESSREVSSVITDFSLANMAWLKAPMGAPSLPAAELLAFAYAGLRPSAALMDKFLAELERLEKAGKLAPRDHQLLRSSTVADEELMRLTLGDTDALTEEAISQTLKRVTTEIKAEETRHLRDEQSRHRTTAHEREQALSDRSALLSRTYWRLARSSRIYAWIFSGLVQALFLVGIAAGFGLSSQNLWLRLIILLGSIVCAAIGVWSWFSGTTANQWHHTVERRILQVLLRRESELTGISLQTNEANSESNKVGN
jgi:hypothetical protein